MIRLLAVATLVACGSAQVPARHDPPTGSASASGSGSATGSGDAPVTADSRPTEQACDALIAHALTVAATERPADQQLSEPERTRLHATTRQRHLAGCRELAPATYQCMLAATTTTALTACK